MNLAEETATNLTPAQRYLTLTTVVLGSSLYGTALLTTSTILPQMQGALSATQDEIAWVMTFNILATAVATPMTGQAAKVHQLTLKHNNLHSDDVHYSGAGSALQAQQVAAAIRAVLPKP